MVEINLDEVKNQQNLPDEQFILVGRDIISKLIHQVEVLQSQVRISVEIMGHLYEDIDALKGEKISVPKDISEKALGILNKKSYSDLLKLWNFATKDFFIEIPESDFGLIPYDVFPIDENKMKFTYSINHRCIHNKSYWVKDIEIEVEKEMD